MSHDSNSTAVSTCSVNVCYFVQCVKTEAPKLQLAENTVAGDTADLLIIKVTCEIPECCLLMCSKKYCELISVCLCVSFQQKDEENGSIRSTTFPVLRFLN